MAEELWGGGISKATVVALLFYGVKKRPTGSVGFRRGSSAVDRQVKLERPR